MPAKSKTVRRDARFESTHREMIDAAVRLISQKGIEALSIAAVARALEIDRTTVYYHFASRDALIRAVKSWSSAQLAKAFNADSPQQERIDYITRFVLENPALIKLWIEDLISVGDIRHSYPHWDGLVKGIRKSLTAESDGDTVDAEVYSVILLTSAIIGPRVFKNSVCPEADINTVIRRFRREEQRLLKHNALLKPTARAAKSAAPRKKQKSAATTRS